MDEVERQEWEENDLIEACKGLHNVLVRCDEDVMCRKFLVVEVCARFTLVV